MAKLTTETESPVKKEIKIYWDDYQIYTEKLSTVCRQLAFAEGGMLWIVFNIHASKLIECIFLFLILYFMFDVLQYYFGMRSYYKLALKSENKYKIDNNIKLSDIEKPQATNKNAKRCFYIKLSCIAASSIMIIIGFIKILLYD